MIARLTGAFGAFLLAFFGQTLALAIVEGFGGFYIDPFGSRTTLFQVTVALSVAAAIARFFLSAPPANGDGASAASSAHVSSAASDTGATGSTRGSAPSAAAAGAERFAPTRQAPAPAPPAPRASPRAADLLAAAGHQAIVFRQMFPPPHDPGILSFFGGAPIAPRDLPWPRVGEAPLHFVLQVDCASIPPSARLGALPNRGVLYFFLDLSWVTSGVRVIYCDGPGDDWQAIVPPPDLGPAFGESAPYVWAWAQTMEQAPVLLPKWPVEPVAIEVPEPAEREEDEPLLWHGNAASELVRAQGDEVRSDYISIRDIVDGQSLRRPFDDFPHDWRAVQICSARLVRDADDARRYPRASMFAGLDKEAKDARLAAISTEAQRWFDRATAEPPFDAPARAVRDEFWAFLAEHAPLTSHVLTQVLPVAIESSIAASAEAAARVPAALVARLRSRHALAVHTDSGLHVNIPDRMLAPPVDVQGNHWERAMDHLLLLELSANEGLGHHFAEGVYQLWIRPDDLLAGRFARVEVTTDAY